MIQSIMKNKKAINHVMIVERREVQEKNKLHSHQLMKIIYPQSQAHNNHNRQFKHIRNNYK